MNIVLGTENAEPLREKYTVLELDTFQVEARPPFTAYCVVENVPFDQLGRISEFSDLHCNLIKNYRLKNWSYCEQAIEYLKGQWNHELDSYYDALYQRIQTLKVSKLPDTWSGAIEMTSTTVPT